MWNKYKQEEDALMTEPGRYEHANMDGKRKINFDFIIIRWID